MPIKATRSDCARIRRQTSGPLIPSSDISTSNTSGAVGALRLLRTASLPCSQVQTTSKEGVNRLIIITKVAKVKRSLSTTANLIRFPSYMLLFRPSIDRRYEANVRRLCNKLEFTGNNTGGNNGNSTNDWNLNCSAVMFMAKVGATRIIQSGSPSPHETDLRPQVHQVVYEHAFFRT